MATRSQFIRAPHEFNDKSLRTVFLAGHRHGAEWQESLAQKLLMTPHAMNISTPRRASPELVDHATRHEDIAWLHRHMRTALGNGGVLAVNLEQSQAPHEQISSGVDDYSEFFAVRNAILGRDLYDGHDYADQIVVRVAPGYSGLGEDIPEIATQAGVRVVAHEAVLIAEILSRLPSPTSSIHS